MHIYCELGFCARLLLSDNQSPLKFSVKVTRIMAKFLLYAEIFIYHRSLSFIYCTTCDKTDTFTIGPDNRLS